MAVRATVGAIRDAETTVRRQFIADTLSEHNFKQRGRGTLRRGLSKVRGDRTNSERLYALASGVNKAIKCVLIHSERVERLSDAYLIRLALLEDHFTLSEVRALRHNMRAEREIVTSYLPQTSLVCSAQDSVDSVEEHLSDNAEMFVEILDQDLLARFDRFCQESRMGTEVAIRQWTQYGLRAAVLSGLVFHISHDEALNVGEQEVQQAIRDPTRYLK